MLKFSRLIAISFLTSIVFSQSSMAMERLDPIGTRCLFYRDEVLKLVQDCILGDYLWTGGGVKTLTWEDGVVTNINFGLQLGGSRPCETVGVDGTCGEWSYQNARGERITREERNRIRSEGFTTLSFDCVDVSGNSICWQEPDRSRF